MAWCCVGTHGFFGCTPLFLQVFELMKQYEVKPDLQTFGIIMNAWCNTGHMHEAKAALLRMKDYELRPDIVTYSILAKGYARAGRPEEGEALLRVMYDENVIPNIVTYTTVISGYCSLAQMDDAMRVFKDMRIRGVRPNMKTFHTLIWGFNEARWPRRAEEVLELIEKSGFLVDDESLDLVAGCWRSIGVPEEAERVLSMKKGGKSVAHNDLLDVVPEEENVGTMPEQLAYPRRTTTEQPPVATSNRSSSFTAGSFRTNPRRRDSTSSWLSKTLLSWGFESSSLAPTHFSNSLHHRHHHRHHQSSVSHYAKMQDTWNHLLGSSSYYHQMEGAKCGLQTSSLRRQPRSVNCVATHRMWTKQHASASAVGDTHEIAISCTFRAPVPCHL